MERAFVELVAIAIFFKCLASDAKLMSPTWKKAAAIRATFKPQSEAARHTGMI